MRNEQFNFCPMSKSNYPECFKGRCAWWMNGKCAIVVIAETLKRAPERIQVIKNGG